MVDIKQKPRLHASWIDPNAKEIVRTLQKEGFTSYLVGGCVRDLLAGIHPKDYDIATSAEPNQVKRKVWGSYVIGRRFRLVLVKRGDQQYEVATFRREMTPDEQAELEADATQQDSFSTEQEEPQKPTIQTDNLFGTPEQDALRRDFTINALFYDPIKDELLDYAQGLPDIEARTLKMIGQPEARIKEDPIRSLRAIRLAHKLKFRIDPDLRLAILQLAPLISHSVLPRRREEFLKFLRLSDCGPAWLELWDLGIIEAILPSLKPIFEDSSRREILLHYLSRFSEICHDTNKTHEVFLPLILGILKAGEGLTQFDQLMSRLLKDELMIFRTEQAIIFETLEMATQLENVDSFKRRGHRRQQALLRNDCLPLALRIARVEYLLKPEHLAFWNVQLLKPQDH